MKSHCWQSHTEAAPDANDHKISQGSRGLQADRFANDLHRDVTLLMEKAHVSLTAQRMRGWQNYSN